MKNYLDFIKCNQCGASMQISGGKLVCSNCQDVYRIFDKNIIQTLASSSEDVQLSNDKWEIFYQKQLSSRSYESDYWEYENRHLKDILRQLKSEINLKKKVYLEIGCGPFFLGQSVAKKCEVVIGIDFCLSALKIAKTMLDKKGIKNYLLIHGDILNLPIKSNKIDIVYGGGVIEHFQNTQRCMEEVYQVLKSGGVSFNTVPYLNLGTLTYRQVWGNIPNLPLLKQTAEFIHIRLLKGRHMIFGYEMSFLGSTLKRIHHRSGFKKIKVEKFDVDMSFDFAPRRLKKTFVWLASNSRLFWPMVKVIGKK